MSNYCSKGHWEAGLTLPCKQCEIERLSAELEEAKDAARLDFITGLYNPWRVDVRKNHNEPIKYRMINDGEPWGKWHLSARAAIDAAMQKGGA